MYDWECMGLDKQREMEKKKKRGMFSIDPNSFPKLRINRDSLSNVKREREKEQENKKNMKKIVRFFGILQVNAADVMGFNYLQPRTRRKKKTSAVTFYIINDKLMTIANCLS